MSEFEKMLRSLLPESLIKKDEPMKDHTSFRTGGPSDFYIAVPSADALEKVLRLCRDCNEPYFVIGSGSNLLVSDRGFRGVILEIGRLFSDIRIDQTKVICRAGARLSAIARAAAEASLEGFEFASGIPGSLGGAVFMNAGAYGGEMKDVVTSVTLLQEDGRVVTRPCGDMGFSYRKSLVGTRREIVLEAVLSLRTGNRADIVRKMDELNRRRREKQPLDYPSAGSSFKRPEGHFAGALIEEAGLKGLRIGGAQVSEKHCGFIINTGNASSEDIYLLMQKVRDAVREKSGVLLEIEPVLLGEFGPREGKFLAESRA